MKKRVAVIGGGIFGATAAVRLAEHGVAVELFERNSDLLMAASGINQYRLHRGYHYPRSLETALSCRDGQASFRDEYGEAVLDDFEHYYAIASHDSLVTAAQFIQFLDAAGLDYQPVEVPFVRSEAVDFCARVREGLFDPDRLRQVVHQKLRQAGVTVRLGHEATPGDVKGYDFVVVATYSSLNTFVEEAGALRQYHFEVCEKPVVRLPPALRGKSVVIMDGPFMCIDPLGTGGLAVLGNVVHAIHHKNVGLAPVIPSYLRSYVNRGIVPRPAGSRFQQFIESAAEFFPDVRAIEYVGSMFTVRTVLPENDDTDARPTLVYPVSRRIITVFSGKIVTCLVAADKVVDIVTAG